MRIAPQSLLTNPFPFLGLLLGLSCVGGPLLVWLLNQPAESTTTNSTRATSHCLQTLQRDAGQADESFGDSVAVWESTALVGCPMKRIDGRAVGNVELFRLDSVGRWRSADSIEEPDLPDGMLFGTAVAVGARRAIVGVCPCEFLHPDAPTAYVYEVADQDSWRRTATLSVGHESDLMIRNVSVALDRDTAILGRVSRKVDTGRVHGLACLFRLDRKRHWQQIATLTLPDEAAAGTGHFGSSVALSGSRALVGAPLQTTSQGSSGAAYIYQEQPPGQWKQVAMLVAHDSREADTFGISVSICGRTALIGAIGEDRTGHNSGAAYLFRESDSGRWTQIAKLAPPDGADWDCFGSSVAVDGEYAVVGAPGCNDAAGAVYVFRLNDNGAEQIAKLTRQETTARSRFGRAVALSRGVVVAGAPWEDADRQVNSGAVYAAQMLERASTRDNGNKLARHFRNQK